MIKAEDDIAFRSLFVFIRVDSWFVPLGSERGHLVKTAIRFSARTCALAIGAACWLAVAGCRGEHSPGEDHEHSGHVIPAHKPGTFPDAVRRLRELNDQLARGAAKRPPDDQTLNVALDIANWIPEIAAESEMPEAPWDEVNARSAALVSDYRTILSGAAVDGRNELIRDAGNAISGLETLLAAADRRWFAGPEKHAEAP
jgi:hypothetical protein